MLVYHAATFSGVARGGTATLVGPGRWLQHLNVGVSVFFVLSGFLLFRPFVAAHLADRPHPAVGPYLWRRLVRIYPAYWVALFVSVQVLDLDLGGPWSTLRYYSLTQIYWGETVLGGLTQAWSLCTEVSFYLFVPVWALALGRAGGTPERRARTHLVALVGLYAVGVATRTWLRSGGHAIGYATLPANADLFAIGMALAVISALAAQRGRSAGGLARTLGDLPGAAWVAAACCYAAVVSLQYPEGFAEPTVSQEVLRQVLFGLVAGLLVAPGVFGDQDRGAIRRVLRWGPLAFVGVVSYGVYLWHVTVQEWLVEPGHLVASRAFGPLVLVSALGSVTIAAMSWFGLERPLLRRIRAGRGLVSPPVDRSGAHRRAGARGAEEPS